MSTAPKKEAHHTPLLLSGPPLFFSLSAAASTQPVVPPHGSSEAAGEDGGLRLNRNLRRIPAPALADLPPPAPSSRPSSHTPHSLIKKTHTSPGAQRQRGVGRKEQMQPAHARAHTHRDTGPRAHFTHLTFFCLYGLF